MAKITEAMAALITAQRLGYVATVNDDGTPNLSPKGTFVVIDGDHVAFSEIRSPRTLKNLADRPNIEVNFVDPFSRRGVRLKGTARVMPAGTAEFDDQIPEFRKNWATLADRIKCIVMIKVERAEPLTSPAYDIGATEAELRVSWAKIYAAQQEAAKVNA